MTHDPRDHREGFRVIDQRRAAVQSLLRGKRRSEGWGTAPPLQRGNQRRLLAADERARAPGHAHLKVMAAAQNAFTEISFPLAQNYGLLDTADGQRVFRAYIQDTRPRARGQAGDSHAFNYTKRVGFEYHPVHKRARVSLVAVADNNFPVTGSISHGLPLLRRWKTRPAAAAQLAHPDFRNNGFRRQRSVLSGSQTQTGTQRLEPAQAPVLRHVGRRHFTAVLRGQSLLRTQKCGYGRIAHIQRVPFGRIPFLPGIRALQPAAGHAAQVRPGARRLEVRHQDRLHVLRPHLCVQMGRLVRQHDFQQRRLVAHAHAADVFYLHADAQIFQRFHQGAANLFAAARHTTGPQPDAYFTSGRRRLFPGSGGLKGNMRLLFQKILQHARHGIRNHMAISDRVNPDGRRKRATAEAGDFLKGEHPFRIRVLGCAEVQVFRHGVIHRSRSLYVARRAIAHADNVFPHWPAPELAEEGRHAFHSGRRYLRKFTHAAQRLLRKILIILLNRLQNGNQVLRPAACAFQDMVHFSYVKICLHTVFSLNPAQTSNTMNDKT
ncbi:MAG: hypothetical protein BWY09_00740 [Candidatus Hydrogenedentes bacterium ADurb.Bin179]|nr:MAG: hypothetical protein BWY09_00740 [Candidatus Hydrogenedentes bacterium ADurb.Bin179]